MKPQVTEFFASFSVTSRGESNMDGCHRSRVVLSAQAPTPTVIKYFRSTGPGIHTRWLSRKAAHYEGWHTPHQTEHRTDQQREPTGETPECRLRHAPMMPHLSCALSPAGTRCDGPLTF